MIIFRTDGNKDIGSGHVMRCLSIADAFVRHDHSCIFVLADDSFSDLIKERGFDSVILNKDYSDPENEIESFTALIRSSDPEMVIVDSYYVTGKYLSDIRKCAFTVYIDDLASWAYPADCIVNYNIYGPDLDYPGLYKDAESTPKTLLGIDYVPVRSMFSNMEKHVHKKTVEDVLISAGGTDPIHFELALAKFIRERSDSVRYHILVGALNPDHEKILKIAEDCSNLIVHYNVSDMRGLISSCDIAVSASGSTLYEICACGVPMVIYSLADNQTLGNQAFEKHGIARSCGDLRSVKDPVEKVLKEVREYAGDYELRCSVGSRMQELVDGYGADRIVEAVLQMLSD